MDQVVDEAIKTAEKIANNSKVMVMMAKEAVNRGALREISIRTCCSVGENADLQSDLFSAFEMSLEEGLNFEKRFFHQTFGTVRSPFVLAKFRTADGQDSFKEADCNK